MPKLLDCIPGIRAPFCCVLQDVDLAALRDGPPIVEQVNSELFGLAQTYDAAKRMIPRPQYPEPRRQDRFHERFGWYDEPLSDGMFMRQIPSFAYCDHPAKAVKLQRSGLATDQELFGRSYTIWWLCPVDPRLLVDSLIDHAKRIAVDPPPAFVDDLRSKHRYGFSESMLRQGIDCRVLWYLWDAYFTRACFWPTESATQVDRQLLATVKEQFCSHVVTLPEGPQSVDCIR